VVTGRIELMLLPSDRLVLEVGGFRLTSRGRFWQVFDPQGRLIVTSVYKKGGLEVIRRLLPADLRHLAEGLNRKEASSPEPPKVTPNVYRT